MEYSDDKWKAVIAFLETRFDKEMDIKAILFILGIQSLGRPSDEFSKEEKMDLMNLGFCEIAALSGFFVKADEDKDGWPIWNQAKALPKMSTKEQEQFIKAHVIKYFESEALI